MMPTATTAPGRAAQRSTVPLDKLIKKYDVRGARYTSYPPATQFQTGMTAEQYVDYLGGREQKFAPLSLYIHVPFCRDICYYCACNKVVTRDPAVAADYVKALVREIDIKSASCDAARVVQQLHIGGGTPTFLDRHELMQLVHILATRFQLSDSDSRDYAVEIDPRTVDEEMLALLAGVGFNRISMGIQDFDADVQAAINRLQPFETVEQHVTTVRALGFRSLNFDLIYGLPLQTIEKVRQTLERVLQLAPDRIAVYNYAHLPERFSPQRALSRYPMPTAAEKLELQHFVRQHLLAAGYVNIGLDHYALPDDDLALAFQQGHLQRNFQGYSAFDFEETIGFGVSAISSHCNYYVQNVVELDAYQRALLDGQLPVGRSCLLTRDDLIRRDVIMALCCYLRVNLSQLGHRYDVNPASYFAKELQGLESLEGDGLLRIKGHILIVTPLGRDFLRNICRVFDSYADSGGAHSVQFSKTL